MIWFEPYHQRKERRYWTNCTFGLYPSSN